MKSVMFSVVCALVLSPVGASAQSCMAHLEVEESLHSNESETEDENVRAQPDLKALEREADEQAKTDTFRHRITEFVSSCPDNPLETKDKFNLQPGQKIIEAHCMCFD